MKYKKVRFSRFRDFSVKFRKRLHIFQIIGRMSRARKVKIYTEYEKIQGPYYPVHSYHQLWLRLEAARLKKLLAETSLTTGDYYLMMEDVHVPCNRRFPLGATHNVSEADVDALTEIVMHEEAQAEAAEMAVKKSSLPNLVVDGGVRKVCWCGEKCVYEASEETLAFWLSLVK
jgi:hypothetical protein